MKRLFIKLSSFIALTTTCLLISGCNGSSNNNTPPTPSSAGIIFGNEQGYLYKNYDILVGESHISSLSGVHPQIKNITIDHNGTLYAVVGSDIGAQTIWKKTYNDKMWQLLSGDGKDGSIDGSMVSSITTDKSNNLYATTTNNHLYTYSEEHQTWDNLGTVIGSRSQPTLLTSIDNTIYIATSYGEILSYKNNTLTRESSIPNIPNDAFLTSMISTNNGIFISYNNQIYQYNNQNVSLYKSLSSNVIYINNLTYNEQTQTLYASVMMKDVDGDTSFQVIKVNPTPDSDELLGNLEKNININSMLVKNNTVFIGIQKRTNQLTYSKVYFFNTMTGTWDQYGNDLNPAGAFLGNRTYLTNDNLHNKLYATAADNDKDLASNVYQLDESTNQWQITGSGTLNGQPIYALLQSANDLYITTSNGQAYKYNEQNKSLTTLVSQTDVSNLSSLAIVNDNLYAGAENIMMGNNIYIYNKTTESWELFQQLYTDESNDNYYVTALYNHNNTFYATTAVKDLSTTNSTGAVWRFESTTNQMVILSGQANESSLDNSGVLSLTLDNANNIYAGTTLGHVWMLAPESNIWTQVGNNYLDYSAITVLSTKNNQIYAGTQGGRIFKLDPNLGNWELISTYLDGSTIMSLITDDSDNQYAITENGNIFLYSNHSWINIHMGNGSQITGHHTAIGIY